MNPSFCQTVGGLHGDFRVPRLLMRVSRPSVGFRDKILPHAHGNGGGIPVGPDAHHAPAPDGSARRGGFCERIDAALERAPHDQNALPKVHVAAPPLGLLALGIRGRGSAQRTGSADTGIGARLRRFQRVQVRAQDVRLHHGARFRVPVRVSGDDHNRLAVDKAGPVVYDTAFHGVFLLVEGQIYPWKPYAIFKRRTSKKALRPAPCAPLYI